MPSRVSSKNTQNSFCPPADAATYRDLLLFEERLKTNAATLNRRKHRYQLFLAHLTLTILFLLSEVLLQTNLLAIPYKYALKTIQPGLFEDDVPVRVHPYIASGLLFVSVTTLVLFFASGMYSEKIGYANRYVPHANRALRNFNMYLNVRQPPLRSKLPFNPFTLLFPRTTTRQTSPSPASPRQTRTPSPDRGPTKRSSSVPIPPIPPASNPRGELIFSSRVDRAFRDSYERYRSTFERRREERERAAYAKTWIGWICTRMPWVKKPPLPQSPSIGTSVGSGGLSMSRSGVGSSASRGGKAASRASTPSDSRRSSPVPSHKSRRTSPTGSATPHPLASGSTGNET